MYMHEYVLCMCVQGTSLSVGDPGAVPRFLETSQVILLLRQFSHTFTCITLLHYQK